MSPLTFGINTPFTSEQLCVSFLLGSKIQMCLNFKRCLHVVSKTLQRKEHSVSFARECVSGVCCPRDRDSDSFSQNMRWRRGQVLPQDIWLADGERIHRISCRFYYGRLMRSFYKPHEKKVLSYFSRRSADTLWYLIGPSLPAERDLKHEKMPDSCRGKTYAADKLELKQLGVQLEVITKYFCQERHIPVVTSLSSN